MIVCARMPGFGVTGWLGCYSVGKCAVVSTRGTTGRGCEVRFRARGGLAGPSRQSRVVLRTPHRTNSQLAILHSVGKRTRRKVSTSIKGTQE